MLSIRRERVFSLVCLFHNSVDLILRPQISDTPENNIIFTLKGHKLSLVYFCYGSVVSLYCTNDVLENYGRVQIKHTLRVSRYGHGKHIVDLHQFADRFVPSSFKSEIIDERHPVFKPIMLESCAPVTVILNILFHNENSIFYCLHYAIWLPFK